MMRTLSLVVTLATRESGENSGSSKTPGAVLRQVAGSIISGGGQEVLFKVSEGLARFVAECIDAFG